MSSQWRSVLAAVVLVLMVTSLAAADVTGSYSCRGTNPGGGAVYTGTVAISAKGEGYVLRWIIGGAGHSGTGLLSGGYLSASWGVAGKGPGGVVVYRVEDDGRLVGKWVNAGGGALGTETLTPR